MNALVNFIIMLCLWIFFTPPPAGAEEVILPKINEQDVIKKINQTRRFPLETAISIGVDIDKVDPWVKSFFFSGMPSLYLDKRLSKSSTDRAFEISADLEKGKIPASLQTCLSKSQDSGYHGVICHDDAWYILFDNFISETQAFKLLYEYALRDEFSQNDIRKLQLLDPFVREAGADFSSFSYQEKSGKNVNGYVLVVHSGSDYLFFLERNLFRLINEARSNPALAFEAMGFDLGTVRGILGDRSWILDEELPLLQWDDNLFDYSRFCFIDQVEVGNHRLILDGPHLCKLPVPDKTTIIRVPDIYNVSDTLVFFEYLIFSELTGFHMNGPVLLDPRNRRIGLGLQEVDCKGRTCIDLVMSASRSVDDNQKIAGIIEGITIDNHKFYTVSLIDEATSEISGSGIIDPAGYFEIIPKDDAFHLSSSAFVTIVDSHGDMVAEVMIDISRGESFIKIELPDHPG